MEFIYAMGKSNWKIKIIKLTPTVKDIVCPCELIITDLSTMDIIFRCDYHSEDKCIEVWERIKVHYESGKCYWDNELKRLVWKSEL